MVVLTQLFQEGPTAPVSNLGVWSTSKRFPVLSLGVGHTGWPRVACIFDAGRGLKILPEMRVTKKSRQPLSWPNDFEERMSLAQMILYTHILWEGFRIEVDIKLKLSDIIKTSLTVVSTIPTRAGFDPYLLSWKIKVEESANIIYVANFCRVKFRKSRAFFSPHRCFPPFFFVSF